MIYVTNGKNRDLCLCMHKVYLLSICEGWQNHFFILPFYLAMIYKLAQGYFIFVVCYAKKV